MKHKFEIADALTEAPTRQRLSQFQVGLVALIVLLASALVYPAHAQTGKQAEYEIKAAILYKLLGYVDWPRAALPTPDAPFTVGVLGQDPSGKLITVLTAVLSDKVIKGRRISVKQLSSQAEIAQCQMIFISVSEKERLSEILESVKQQPVLTVSETAGFAERGGHINLPAGSNSVSMEINNASVSNSGLTISSQLLKLRLVKLIKG